MKNYNSTLITELSIQESQELNGEIIPLAIIAIAKSIALISASDVAGGALGYGIYKIFN